MKQFEFHLDLSPDRYLAYYQGLVRDVVVRCRDGQTVQFPAALLKAFVSPSGIHGSFRLVCDDQNKGARLERVS